VLREVAPDLVQQARILLHGPRDQGAPVTQELTHAPRAVIVINGEPPGSATPAAHGLRPAADGAETVLFAQHHVVVRGREFVLLPQQLGMGDPTTVLRGVTVPLVPPQTGLARTPGLRRMQLVVKRGPRLGFTAPTTKYELLFHAHRIQLVSCYYITVIMVSLHFVRFLDIAGLLDYR
jgi:hypothetical protein